MSDVANAVHNAEQRAAKERESRLESRADEYAALVQRWADGESLTEDEQSRALSLGSSLGACSAGDIEADFEFIERRRNRAAALFDVRKSIERIGDEAILLGAIEEIEEEIWVAIEGLLAQKRSLVERVVERRKAVAREHELLAGVRADRAYGPDPDSARLRLRAIARRVDELAGLEGGDP